MTDNLLEQGVAALKEGRKEDARRLLAQVLEQDEQNEMAWLWMSGVVETDAERRVCLENVLAINPSNGIAKRGLESLGASQQTSPFTTVRPLAPKAGKATTSSEQSIQPLPEAGEPDVPDTPEETEPKESAGEGEHDQPPPSRRATKRRPSAIIGLGVGLLGILCIAIVGIWWMFTSGPLSFQPVPTLVPTMDLGQTSTPTVADATPTSDAALLSAEPTATDVPPTLVPTRTPRPTQTPLLTWTPSLTPTATMTTTATATPTPAMTLPPTWTPHPTSTPAAGMTLPPTWTPQPTNTPAAGMTLPPTWTPAPTITLPPTWTPAYSTNTPTVTPTLTLTGTAVITATPGG